MIIMVPLKSIYSKPSLMLYKLGILLYYICHEKHPIVVIVRIQLLHHLLQHLLQYLLHHLLQHLLQRLLQHLLQHLRMSMLPSKVQGVTVTRTIQGSSPALSVSWSAINGSGINYTVCYSRSSGTQSDPPSSANCGTSGITGTSTTLGPTQYGNYLLHLGSCSVIRWTRIIQ